MEPSETCAQDAPAVQLGVSVTLRSALTTRNPQVATDLHQTRFLRCHLYIVENTIGSTACSPFVRCSVVNQACGDNLARQLCFESQTVMLLCDLYGALSVEQGVSVVPLEYAIRNERITIINTLENSLLFWRSLSSFHSLTRLFMTGRPPR